MEPGHLEPVAHVCLSRREPGPQHRYKTVTRAQSCVLHIRAVTQAARCVLSTGVNSFPFLLWGFGSKEKKKKKTKKVTNWKLHSVSLFRV